MYEELNKMLTEWAGIKYLGDGRWLYDGIIHWQKPDDLTQSLDACFKLLVPKLGWCSVEHIIMVDPMGFPKKPYQLPYTESPPSYYFSDAPRYHWYRATLYAGDGNTKIIKDDQDPALALCLAIEKLIEVKDAD